MFAMQMRDPSRPVTGNPAPIGCPPFRPSTVYPYSAPPQHQPPYYDNNNRAPSSLRRFLTNTLLVLLVGGLIIFFLWLVSLMSTPKFQVHSLSLSNFSVSDSSSITGNWNVSFSVTNPNTKTSLAYYDIAASIFYKSELISDTQLPPFNQQKRNRTVLVAAFSATNTYVGASVANDINGDQTLGTVRFNVKVFARIVFTSGGWTSRHRLKVFCKGVAVGVSPNRTGSGNLVGGPRDCSVGL